MADIQVSFWVHLPHFQNVVSILKNYSCLHSTTVKLDCISWIYHCHFSIGNFCSCRSSSTDSEMLSWLNRTLSSSQTRFLPPYFIKWDSLFAFGVFKSSRWFLFRLLFARWRWKEPSFLGKRWEKVEAGVKVPISYKSTNIWDNWSMLVPLAYPRDTS